MPIRSSTPRWRKKSVNPAQVFEAGPTETNRRQQREEWLRKNRAALAAYNEYVEERGVFSDGLRSF